MAKNISNPKPPVKTAEQCEKEQAATEKRWKAKLREHRKTEQAKPLTQSLGDLLKQAGVA